MNIIDFEALTSVVIAAYVVTTILEKIKSAAQYHWDKLSEDVRQLVGYGVVIVAAILLWLTGLDMFPGFDVIVPSLGRVLTSIAGGFGPKFVYDIWMDRPEAPTRE